MNRIAGLMVLCLVLFGWSAQAAETTEKNGLPEQVRYHETVIAFSGAESNASGQTSFYAFGQEFVLNLEAMNDLASDEADRRSIRRPEEALYRGTVQGDDGSWLRGSMTGSVFEGVIHTSNDDYFVERASRHFADRPDDEMIIYRRSDCDSGWEALAGGPIPVIANITSTQPGMATIYGSGFSANAPEVRVFFGGYFAPLKSTSRSAIVVKIPSGALRAGTVAVHVVVKGVWSDGYYFRFGQSVPSGPAPVITNVTSTQPGMATISGSGFSANAPEVRVFFGGYFAPLKSTSRTAILVKIPSGALRAGTVAVHVVVKGVWSDGYYFRFGQSVPSGPAPVITNVTSTQPGMATISGSGFSTNAAEVRVFFGGYFAPLKSTSRSAILVKIPSGALRAGTVAVHAVVKGVWSDGYYYSVR
ncbi:MAG: IPT/TIG domain-containing protein [Acidobacteriota bacterium]